MLHLVLSKEDGLKIICSGAQSFSVFRIVFDRVLYEICTIASKQPLIFLIQLKLQLI